MLTTVILGVLAVTLGLGTIASLAITAADRSARAEAWRRIAVERRWNHENITTPTRDTYLPEQPDRFA